MWWLLWLVLVLGAVGVLFWVGRRLWRQGAALLEATSSLSDVMDTFDRRTAELTERAQAAHPVEPITLEDLPRAERLRAAADEVTAQRRARRDARREATYRRWASFSR